MFVGLLMEKLWDKKWHSNISDFRRSKSIREFGAWIVIGGIVLEIVIAVFFAKYDWQNDPENRPIREVSANVWFLVKGGDFKDSSGETPRGALQAFIIPYETNELANGILPGSLIAEKYLVGYCSNSPTADRLYSMRFSAMTVASMPEMRSAKELKTIKRIAIKALFLASEAEVLNGNAILVANGNIQESFLIPQQKRDKTNDFLIFATNAPSTKIFPPPFDLYNGSIR